MELNEEIKEKLSEVVALWADKNLIGKPALLATCMYYNLEKAMIESIEQINENFKDR